MPYLFLWPGTNGLLTREGFLLTGASFSCTDFTVFCAEVVGAMRTRHEANGYRYDDTGLGVDPGLC